ncbi:MAG: histidine phosphatase family protein [Chloroflexi bacterium]|nr:histidine phosphatase family protein [Chloroflexota bacterium]
MAEEPLTIYLIRHGQSQWNREGRVQGQSDSPLSALGLLQAQRLWDRLAGVPLTAVFSSSLQRCRSVAELLAEDREVPLVYMHGLMERSQGDWEPLLIEEANRLFPEERQRVRWDPRAAPPGGESAVEVWDRLHVAWRRLLERSHGAVAVVSHSGVLSMILGSTLGLPRDTPFAGYPFYLAPCSVTTLATQEQDYPVRQRRLVVLGINDVCHLRGLPHDVTVG